MRNWKGILAAILTVAISLTTMTMTAFAAPDSEEGTASTINSVIDPDHSGSITIHKYEKDNVYLNPGQTGTGKELGSDTVPGGKNPLKDVTFEIYQIANKDELLRYYDGTEAGIVYDISKYVDDKTGTLIEDALPDEAYAVGTTDLNGTVRFDVPLGLYLVVESKSPDAVMAKVSPFIVAVPMTVDNTEWLYDVHVYPKNETAYYSVYLQKFGVTSGYDNAIGLGGVKFELQKWNPDANNGEGAWEKQEKNAIGGIDNEGEWFEEPDEEEASDGFITTDSNGRIKVSGLSAGKYRFIERSLGSNDGYIKSNKAYGFEVYDKGEGTLDIRFDEDVVTWQEGGASATWAPTYILVTNDKPDFEKKVAPKENPSNWGKSANYCAGDEIPYKLTVKVPECITDMECFEITDEPVNLKDKIDTIELKCTELDPLTPKYEQDPITGDFILATGAYLYDVDEGAYRVEATSETTSGNDDTGFKIVFNTEEMEKYAGKQIVITYKAELLSSCCTTTDGNPNTARLEYSRQTKGTIEGDPYLPDDDTGTAIIEDKALIFTFRVDVQKIGTDDSGMDKYLPEVKFDLYREAKEGETSISDEDKRKVGLDLSKGWIKLNQPGRFGTDADSDGKLITDEKGEVSISGLGKGVYYLVETETADGYNLLKEPVEIIIEVSYGVAVESSPKWTIREGRPVLEKFKLLFPVTFSSKSENGDFHSFSSYELTVYNKKGFTLPSTGGMGTWGFTFTGIAMMAAAGMVLAFIRSKEKSK